MGERNTTQPVLILGVGNILMKDDGVGVHVVNRLAGDSGLPEDAEVMDGGTAGFDLLGAMRDRERIVIVDALSMDDAPGSVYRFSPEDAAACGRGYSLHDVGILDVVRTARMMGQRPEVVIIGIVPEDVSTMEIGLSRSVEDAVSRAVSIVREAATR